jgi:hypothetical protein
MTPSDIPYGNGTGNVGRPNREFFGANREFDGRVVSVHFSHTCSAGPRTRSVLTAIFVDEEGEMSDTLSRRTLRPRRSGERTMRHAAPAVAARP